MINSAFYYKNATATATRRYAVTKVYEKAL